MFYLKRRQDKFNEAFNRVFDNLNFPDLFRGGQCDISDSDADYRVSVGLPGYKKEDVSISVEDTILKIVAEKTVSSETETESIVSKSSSSYEQRILLNDNVEAEIISAKMADGMLTIIIPKKVVEKKEPKTIEIR